MKCCQGQAQGLPRRNSLTMAAERRHNEKKTLALLKLLKQFPAFTKIYKENLLLKQDKDRCRLEDEALVLAHQQHQEGNLQHQGRNQQHQGRNQQHQERNQPHQEIKPHQESNQQHQERNTDHPTNVEKKMAGETTSLNL